MSEAEMVGLLNKSIAARYHPETGTVILHPSHYERVIVPAHFVSGSMSGEGPAETVTLKTGRADILFTKFSWT